MNLLQRSVTLTQDINGRQASNFVYAITSKRYNVWFVVGDRRVNAKSILGILSANLKKDDNISIIIDCDDVNELNEIEQIINS